MESYPRFLLSQQRAAEVAPAIARYQAALKTARGPDTGWLEDPLRLTIDMERGRNSPQAAIPVAQNLLALEESLDGPISEPGYRAAETLADLYRSINDSARALPLYQQTITIADSIFRADDSRRTPARRSRTGGPGSHESPSEDGLCKKQRIFAIAGTDSRPAEGPWKPLQLSTF